jgi:hypothetical protein
MAEKFSAALNKCDIGHCDTKLALTRRQSGEICAFMKFCDLADAQAGKFED